MRTKAELTKRLNELGITFRPEPILVAGLYIDLIEATYEFFYYETTGLKKYSFDVASFREKVRDVSPSQISTAPREIGKIMPAIRGKGSSGLLNHLFKAPHGKDSNNSKMTPRWSNASN